MKQFLLFVAMSTILVSCASLKGNVSVEHKSDATTATKTTSDAELNALKAYNKVLAHQLEIQKKLNVDKNIHTTTTTEDATVTQQGFGITDYSIGNHTSNPISVSRIVSRGRIKAIATYYYKNDSMVVRLSVKDTVINIHKTVVDNTDKSKLQSSSDTRSSSHDSSGTLILVHKDTSGTTDTKTTKQADTKVKGSFSAAIGVSNWIPIIIAFVIGLFLGKLLFGRKK